MLFLVIVGVIVFGFLSDDILMVNFGLFLVYVIIFVLLFIMVLLCLFFNVWNIFEYCLYLINLIFG